MRFGKHPPKSDYRTLLLSNYVASNIPAHPTAFSALARFVSKQDKSSISKLFPMDGNDRYGDCTIAGAAHAATVWKGWSGHRSITAEKTVLKTYMHLTGGIDSGLNMLDVLNYWRKTGIASEKILAYAKVRARNPESVKQAIHLFGGCYLGFQVPEACMDQFNAGQEWTPSKLTDDGHCVHAVAYDDKRVGVLTWGALQWASWDWWLEAVDEAYAVVPQEAKDATFFPGLDVAALLADLPSVS